MQNAERPLVWCTQCENCKVVNNELYCRGVCGKMVKLPEASIYHPGYCQRYEEKKE